MLRLFASLLLAPAVSACGPEAARPNVTLSHALVEAPEPVALPEWRGLVASEDGRRIDRIDTTLSEMLGRLRTRLTPADKPLLDAGALDFPHLSPGSYRCRAVQLRAAGSRVQARSYPKQYCYISADDGVLGFAKQTGSEGLAGYFHADGDRYVFIGARQPRAGVNGVAYDRDAATNRVGTVERVGNFQWRLTVTGTTPGALDVYELTPVPAEQQPRG